MNATHIHLLTNHIPIIGMACGVFMLAWGIFGKSRNTLLAAIIMLFLTGVGGVITNTTGEDAEHAVEKISGVTQQSIEDHEEAAEGAMPFIAGTIALSAAALFFALKNHRWSVATNYLLLLVAGLAFIMAARAGFIGGKIRHAQEINAPAAAPSAGDDD